jgi:hypothetical protein
VLAPVVVIEAGTLLATGRKHRRIELPVSEMPLERVTAILAMRVPCAACGSPIQPFRSRKGKSAGRAERPGRLFLALSCALGERFGCARGTAASAATERVIRDVEARRLKPKQLDLF